MGDVDYRYTEDFYASKNVRHTEEFITNSRGMKLSTCSWVPASREVKALVFLLHGYGVDCGLWWQATGLRLAANGYGAFGIDFEGHGKSDGRRALLKSMDPLVDDCLSYFKTIYDQEKYVSKPRFLYGESMGGAVSLLIHRRQPLAWTGAVLIAPMVKISESLKPPPIVTAVLKRVAIFAPTWQIVPTKDIIDSAYRVPEKRDEVRRNPYSYTAKPRLATAVTLLNVSNELESRLGEVTIPFLLLHGEADTVTDPSVSKALYQKANSSDKTFKLYPEMWHSLTEGEPDENVDIVFKDIFAWLAEKSAASGGGAGAKANL